MRDAGRIVAQVFARLAEAVRPGISLRELDRLATEYLKSQGAQPLYKGYRGNPPSHPPFPGVICTSVNHEICHGLPDKRVLREGDIVAVDIGLKYKGYCGDACVTYAVGQVTPEAQQLMKVTQNVCTWALTRRKRGGGCPTSARRFTLTQNHTAIAWCASGAGTASDGSCTSLPRCRTPARRTWPYSSPRHGLYHRADDQCRTAGMGSAQDGWTVVTVDGSLSAQFEHTIAITDRGRQDLVPEL